MDLPINFDDFKPLIEFYRAQGVDCLKSNNEKWRFIYCFMKSWTLDYINERGIYFYMDDILTKSFRYDQVPSVNEYNKANKFTIISYLQKVCHIQMKPTTEEKIIITNKFNDCQLTLSKQLFEAYCGYAALNEGYNQQIITIPISFDQDAARLFVDCLNKSSMSFPKIEDLKCYEQVFDLMNFLCVKF